MRRGKLFAQGNAAADSIGGWFIGHFIPFGDLRTRSDLEVKWGVHAAGERRSRGWSSCGTATTASILVQGRFLIRLRTEGEAQEIRLETPGDYVIFGAGVAHDWEAPEDAVVLTIRMPSVADGEVSE